MARYNAMRNYNKFRNGGVARIRPSYSPMPMSRPNTLLGASMSNQYGNNIQGYQEGTSSAYSRFKPLFAGGKRRFQEETDFSRMRRNVEAQTKSGMAGAGAGKWFGKGLSMLLQRVLGVPEKVGQLLIDPALEGLGSYIGGKVGYGEEVDISTEGPWYKPAREELKGYQEKVIGQFADIGKAQALESLGEGLLDIYGPKLPGEDIDGEDIDGKDVLKVVEEDIKEITPKQLSTQISGVSQETVDLRDFPQFKLDEAYQKAKEIAGVGGQFMYDGYIYLIGDTEAEYQYNRDAEGRVTRAMYGD